MSRYVDIEPIIASHTSTDCTVSEISFAEVLYAPSIDIVRCRECKKRKTNKFCLEHMRYEKNDEGFCSYGEREGYLAEKADLKRAKERERRKKKREQTEREGE